MVLVLLDALGDYESNLGIVSQRGQPGSRGAGAAGLVSVLLSMRVCGDW